MSEKSEALRLADALDAWDGTLMMPAGWRQRTSAELRFLHAENEELRRERDEARRTVREAHDAGTRLTAQRDALLEALKEIVAATDSDEWNPVSTVKARAAIKAVEEGK
jgi:hypothetical protein